MPRFDRSRGMLTFSTAIKPILYFFSWPWVLIHGSFFFLCLCSSLFPPAIFSQTLSHTFLPSLPNQRLTPFINQWSSVKVLHSMTWVCEDLLIGGNHILRNQYLALEIQAASDQPTTAVITCVSSLVLKVAINLRSAFYAPWVPWSASTESYS